MKLYWKRRVWTDMYQLFVNLESVLKVLPDEQEQLLEAHRLTVGEFARLKEILDGFIVQYVRRPCNVNLIKVALVDPPVSNHGPVHQIARI